MDLTGHIENLCRTGALLRCSHPGLTSIDAPRDYCNSINFLLCVFTVCSQYSCPAILLYVSLPVLSISLTVRQWFPMVFLILPPLASLYSPSLLKTPSPTTSLCQLLSSYIDLMDSGINMLAPTSWPLHLLFPLPAKLSLQDLQGSLPPLLKWSLLRCHVQREPFWTTHLKWQPLFHP